VRFLLSSPLRLMKRSLIPWYSNRAHVYDIEFQGGEVALNHIASVATSPPPGDGDLLPPGCALWHCGLYGNLMTIQRCCEVVVLDPVTGRWDIWGRRFSASSSCEDAHLTVVRPLRCYLSTPGNTHWRMLCAPPDHDCGWCADRILRRLHPGLPS